MERTVLDRCPYCGSRIGEGVAEKILEVERERHLLREQHLRKEIEDEITAKVGAAQAAVREEERNRADEERQALEQVHNQSEQELKESLTADLNEARQSLQIELSLVRNESDRLALELEAQQLRTQELETQRGTFQRETEVSLRQLISREFEDTLVAKEVAWERERELAKSEKTAIEDAYHQLSQDMQIKVDEEVSKALQFQAQEFQQQMASVSNTREADQSQLQLQQDAITHLTTELEERRRLIEELQTQNASIVQETTAVMQEKHTAELLEQRALLEKDRDDKLLEQSAAQNRTQEGLLEKIKELERKVAQQTSNEIGDGAQIALFDQLKDQYPDDHLHSVPKGIAGPDIHHEVCHKGEVCGRIIYDSKKRQQWRHEYVTKLHKEMVELGAQHALLVTTVFPSGEKDLCVQSGVVVVSPTKARHIVDLLRRSLIDMHVLGLTQQQRQDKTTELFDFIASPQFRQRFEEIDKLSDQLLELDVDEKKAHDRVWKKRGLALTRLRNEWNDLDRDIVSILQRASRSPCAATA